MTELALTKGDRVAIYEDPIDCTRLEGHAVLKCKLKGDATLEYWYVIFTADPGQECLRAVNLNNY